MGTIHPVIRIVSFVIFTAFLALGGAVDILVGAVVVGFLHAGCGGQAWPSAWRLLRRMRWLFLSIAVIYLWLTPGVPLLPVSTRFAEWLPTVDGLWQGGLRIAALALMVIAASLLLQVTPRDQILAALRWLLAPLGLMGFPHERFAVRAALSLEAVTKVQANVRSAMADVPDTIKPMARIGVVTAAIFRVVMQGAENSPCVAILLPAQRPPSLLQWSVPLSLIALMTTARYLPL